MKAVILAGGLGSRISEETHLKPKPMIEIGGRPLLWHIMKIYSFHGINEFIICCGYKGVLIKEYFANYFLHSSDITIDLSNSNNLFVHEHRAEPWRVTLVDTGEHTGTGGRLKRVSPYLKGEDLFCFTYGDGVASIDIREEIEFHRKMNKLATVAAVYPPARFGALEIKDHEVINFREKPKGEQSRINGGFFVLEPKCLDYIENDSTPWEGEPLERLCRDKQLASFEHDGFWHPMDTLRDKAHLDELWSKGAPWKVWNDEHK